MGGVLGERGGDTSSPARASPRRRVARLQVGDRRRRGRRGGRLHRRRPRGARAHSGHDRALSADFHIHSMYSVVRTTPRSQGPRGARRRPRGPRVQRAQNRSSIFRASSRTWGPPNGRAGFADSEELSTFTWDSGVVPLSPRPSWSTMVPSTGSASRPSKSRRGPRAAGLARANSQSPERILRLQGLFHEGAARTARRARAPTRSGPTISTPSRCSTTPISKRAATSRSPRLVLPPERRQDVLDGRRLGQPHAAHQSRRLPAQLPLGRVRRPAAHVPQRRPGRDRPGPRDGRRRPLHDGGRARRDRSRWRRAPKAPTASFTVTVQCPS